MVVYRRAQHMHCVGHHWLVGQLISSISTKLPKLEREICSSLSHGTSNDTKPAVHVVNVAISHACCPHEVLVFLQRTAPPRAACICSISHLALERDVKRRVSEKSGHVSWMPNEHRIGV